MKHDTDATAYAVRTAIRMMEQKKDDLVMEGKEQYADEIDETFRPSAKLFLAAWESLLDDIELDDDDYSDEDEEFELKSINPNTYGY